MQIIGCDLHARQQTITMLNVDTGELVEKTLKHEAEEVREFYFALPGPVRVGIEATGSMQWFIQLMEELGIDCQVGHPAKIRASEPRKQKHDRRDAALLLKLLAEKTASLLSGCPRWSNEIYARCCCTVISGCAFGRRCRTRCKPSRSNTV